LLLPPSPCCAQVKINFNFFLISSFRALKSLRNAEYAPFVLSLHLSLNTHCLGNRFGKCRSAQKIFKLKIKNKKQKMASTTRELHINAVEILEKCGKWYFESPESSKKAKK
jgi:hypothetical protein